MTEFSKKKHSKDFYIFREKMDKGEISPMEQINRDIDKAVDLCNPPKTLKELHMRIRKWLYITDMDRIDLTLAVILSNKARNSKPIWLFIIGESGDAKSEVLGALKDYPDVIQIDQITENTLATGKVHKGKKVPDLGEKLQHSSHILTFMDLASLKSTNVDRKNEIWGQFRELYDGRINKRTGNDTEALYGDCHVTLIACTTPDIKAEYSIHNQLGTREFSYQSPKSSEDDNIKKMKKARQHLGHESEMKKDLQKAVQGFLTNKTIDMTIEPSEELDDWIIQKCIELASFRATVPYERGTGDTAGDVSTEIPTRLIQQMILLYKAMMSLEKDYPVEKFKTIVENIVRSSGDKVRYEVFQYIRKWANDGHTLNELHNALGYGGRTIKRQCETLVQQKYIERVMVSAPEGTKEARFETKIVAYRWRVKLRKQLTLNRSA